MSNVQIDAVIETYVKLRDQKAEIEDAVKEQLEAINVKLAKFEAYLKQRAKADGVDSFKSAHGTAFIATTDYANVNDWDVLSKFIIANELWDMLPRSVTKTAVRTYLKENKELPPGVTYGTMEKLNVRRPSKKAGE